MHATLARAPLLFQGLKLVVLVPVDGFQGVGKVGHHLFLDGQLLAQAPVVGLQLLDVVAQHAAHGAHHPCQQEAQHPPAAPPTLPLPTFTASQPQPDSSRATQTFAVAVIQEHPIAAPCLCPLSLHHSRTLIALKQETDFSSLAIVEFPKTAMLVNKKTDSSKDA